MGLRIVILAAGKGKRMCSELPKVLHKLGGKSLLEHVIDTAKSLQPDSISIVHGNGGDHVQNTLAHLDVDWVYQKEQLGTGHAVMQAIPKFDDNDQVLVLYGDVPLVRSETLQELLATKSQEGLALIVGKVKDPTGLGRIIRNKLGNIIAIVEDRDANEDQRMIREINTGIMTTKAKHLKNWLPRLQNKNQQGEYYLTDCVALAVHDSVPVGGIIAPYPERVLGINNRWELAIMERSYQMMQAKKFAYAGVTVKDPRRLDIRGDVDLAVDVILDANVLLEGDVKIGAHSYIGPNVTIKDSTIGENVHIKANSVIEGAVIGDACEVGPFARIRPGTELKTKAKIGNFVETKKTTVGEGSKASHLTYLGDTTIGKNVNIGAGTITCNYDGVNKSQTIIEDGAFIGSNSSLVAPIKIGKNATVGAGSTLSSDAPADQLTLERAEQKTVRGWKRPTKKKEKVTT